MTDTRLKELEQELAENAAMLSGLSADWMEGILSEEEYRDMKEYFSGRCEELESQVRTRRQRVEKAGEAVREARQWLSGFKDMESWLSVTEGMLRRSFLCILFEKIWVYEGKRVEFSFFYQDRMAEIYALCGMLKETTKLQPFYEKGAV